ncbi:aminopeptidase P family protein [Thalassomonas viridans]|uniref:Aminopeptidase P family protein n=1 Tax=Thalassomonas viridans TaxID=137584 RepID=A0AAF0CAT5_9GAMM|nr:Xaa-Pro peptidase family protein [Thalassomonas viridans]WDE08905.1 aminopeptidase P family protein [Thalassomonas viridans]WDE08952.1 aminopeptidase P family protein [Thalassomonas viridans]
MNFSPIYTAPNEEEMASRKNKLLALMSKNDLDCFVITDPKNVFWLTNFANYVHERPFILVLSGNGELSFIVPKLEILHVKYRIVGDVELLSYDEFPCPDISSWQTLFTKTIAPFKKVGVEEVTPQFIANKVNEKPFASELIEQARYIKSDYEIGRIIYACNIATKAMEKLLNKAGPGVSMLSIHSKVTKLMMLQILTDNPETNALATNVAAVVQPPNVSHDPHNFTNIMDMDMTYGGPHVSIINGVMNGYGTEVERTFFLGKVPRNAIKPYQVMMEARELCLQLCKPGTDMHDVDNSVISLFAKYGYADNILHRTGHSIGVTGHEGPFLAKGFHYEIKPGMLFTIEPGIYIEGIGGFRHSDTVLITESGNTSLTPVKDSLSDMTLPARKANFSLSAFNKKRLFSFYNRYFGLDV